MLSEDTGEFTDDRPWVSKGTLERFEANRSFRQSREYREPLGMQICEESLGDEE